MKSLAFQQVDVFTAVPFKGNPVAVEFEDDTIWLGGDAVICIEGSLQI
jgi:predicted PhzF superfamily epimerase YddE/YHI9